MSLRRCQQIRHQFTNMHNIFLAILNSRRTFTTTKMLLLICATCSWQTCKMTKIRTNTKWINLHRDVLDLLLTKNLIHGICVESADAQHIGSCSAREPARTVHSTTPVHFATTTEEWSYCALTQRIKKTTACILTLKLRQSCRCTGSCLHARGSCGRIGSAQ